MMNMEKEIKEAKEIIMNMNYDEFMEMMNMIIASEHEYGHNYVNDDFEEKMGKFWKYFL